MKTNENIWGKNNPKQLSKVLCGITDVKTMQNFVRDVMTEKEIVEIGSRLEAAKMLTDGNKYTDVIEETKLSSRTVARISEWLQNGCNGYKEAINLINHHYLTS
jgi:TrpR-related protein YerC/YecD